LQTLNSAATKIQQFYKLMAIGVKKKIERKRGNTSYMGFPP
jgi:hypothetical protein